MAPLGETAIEDETIPDLFACGLCFDVMLAPTTLTCCGKSFCRRCLRQWIKNRVHLTGVPRCPAGCTSKIQVRLPARTHALIQAMEKLIPERLELRRREEEEDAEANQDDCRNGFKAWQEVAAARDIIFGNEVGVRQGTPGILIGDFTDGRHVTVRFDTREDGSDLCVNVLPEVLMEPLPGGFRLGQRIVASYDLMLGEQIGVKLGTAGVVLGRLNEHPGRLMVSFDERRDEGVGAVSVHFKEITHQRHLVGGFCIAQQVQAAMDLIVDSQVVVKTATHGIVLGEFSDTRLTVVFDQTDENYPQCFNVLPSEVKTWCELPEDLPTGSPVQTTKDLLNIISNSVVVKAGSRGIIMGAVDETQVLVSFESNADGHPLTLTVELNSFEKAEL